MILGKNLAIRHIGIVIARCFRLSTLVSGADVSGVFVSGADVSVFVDSVFFFVDVSVFFVEVIGLLGICILRRFLLHSRFMLSLGLGSRLLFRQIDAILLFWASICDWISEISE